MRPTIWRVRVLRTLEDWVEVPAGSASEAEIDAGKIPGIVRVFGRSAIRGDIVAAPERPAGVRDE